MITQRLNNRTGNDYFRLRSPILRFYDLTFATCKKNLRYTAYVTTGMRSPNYLGLGGPRNWIFRVLFMSDSLSSIWGQNSVLHFAKFPMLRFSKGYSFHSFHPISTKLYGKYCKIRGKHSLFRFGRSIKNKIKILALWHIFFTLDWEFQNATSTVSNSTKLYGKYDKTRGENRLLLFVTLICQKNKILGFWHFFA